MTFAAPKPEARATVIIPTFGPAPFLLHSLASAQAQTVKELEICVICDGSPPQTVDMVRQIAAKDPRIRVFDFPKAPRTGEIHRPKALAQTTGKIVCYLSHDDLWFSNHVETMERVLQNADFANSLPVALGLGKELGAVRIFIMADIALKETRDRMMDLENPVSYISLTFGAHTREAYYRLDEGWNVTPDGIWTDLHMWRKFFAAPWCRCITRYAVTAAHFERSYWSAIYSDAEFAAELARCLEKMSERIFQDDIFDQGLKINLPGIISSQHILRSVLREELNAAIRPVDLIASIYHALYLVRRKLRQIFHVSL